MAMSVILAAYAALEDELLLSSDASPNDHP
jgi:hypothetical protein